MGLDNAGVPDKRMTLVAVCEIQSNRKNHSPVLLIVTYAYI